MTEPRMVDYVPDPDNKCLGEIQRAMFIINMMRGKKYTVPQARRFNQSIREIQAAARDLKPIEWYNK